MSLDKRNDDAFTFQLLGAVPERRKRRDAEGRPGSKNGGIATGRLTREPGRPCIVHVANPGSRGDPGEQCPLALRAG
ncbi:MAG: hypothetical protein OXH71_05765 [Candidatus Dadabacteria bacterium]|nr:hypothetical protein [Candidatus Dadabacteria bacterium]MDE0520180.1 hypothetical protein [Candidatus Dadabacteria bacterium]MDE0663308.1 hypothetical protein [Candidatus Dadabacteria bacterium]